MTESSQETRNGGPIMDISEHLQELRARLIKALIGVGVVLAVCLFYQDQIMHIITRPHRKAMESLREKIAESRVNPKEGEPTEAEKMQAAIEEFRKESPKGAAAAEMIARKLFDFEEKTQKRYGTLQTIKYQEAFISYLKACIVAALILSSPWVFLQLWAFIGTGLYPHEKRGVIIYLPFSFFAFACGVVFGYYILIPTGLTYLATYADPELVSVQITLGFYLGIFLLLTVALGVIFQLPLMMMFLAKAGIFTPQQYAKYRRHMLLGAVIIGAILTPPDPVTQILLASPVFFLYELGVQLSRLTAKKKKEAQE